jgi:hypothetical protein
LRVKESFMITVGAFVRGSAKRTLRRLSFIHNVKCTIEEEKGLLDSDIYVTISGESQNVEAFKEAILEYQSLF